MQGDRLSKCGDLVIMMFRVFWDSETSKLNFWVVQIMKGSMTDIFYKTKLIPRMLITDKLTIIFPICVLKKFAQLLQ